MQSNLHREHLRPQHILCRDDDYGGDDRDDGAADDDVPYGHQDRAEQKTHTSSPKRPEDTSKICSWVYTFHVKTIE